MTSSTTQATKILFLALVVASFLFLGSQRQAHALGNPDLPGVPECADLIDNDNDGQMDFIPVVGGDGAGPDTDCENIFDDSEGPSTPVTAQCADGIDNDDDGFIDLADSGCTNSSDNDETNASTLGSCEDGIDNDHDGFTDTIDPNCHTDGDATNAASYDADRAETGDMPACWDGIDNDNDGTTDWGLPSDENRDVDCSTPTDNSESGTGGGGGGGGGAENTLPLCTDGIDNDADELIDLADPNCSAFMPKLQVLKVVINDNNGVATVGSFPLFISKNFATSTVVSGATSTVTAGTWTVTETSNSSYTATFSGDCNASGQVILAAGQAKTCVITNNDVAPGGEGGGGNTPQCADGIDNDTDGLKDEYDPGCHSDNNAENTFSYVATDNDETHASGGAPSGGGGGGGGGGNGPIAGGGGNGPIVGQVLGSSTSTLPAGCTALLTTYMRMGKKDNNVEEVKKLQQFLNDHIGANLPITGFFGPLTDAAVRKFQTANTGDVLTPWGIDASTGFVYQTTQRWINLTNCKTLSIPVPVLTPFKEN